MDTLQQELAYYKEQLEAKTRMLDMTTRFLETARQTLEEKNKALAEAHESILDGVRFAGIIQRNLLPDVKVMEEVCKDAAYAVRQKIGIGGDCVFIKKVEQRIVFGLLDSTGHGIPGAMLSVAGNLAINEMLFINEDSQPADLCKYLSHRLHSAFNNSGQALGHMEGAIFSTGEEKGKFKYVSAKGKAIVAGKEGIKEIKPTKSAIGDKENTFMDSEISVQPGEMLCLFSDGLVDQFGGTNNRKYSKARFYQFVVEHRGLAADSIVEAILAEHEKWKGRVEQTDDISVLIVKF